MRLYKALIFLICRILGELVVLTIASKGYYSMDVREYMLERQSPPLPIPGTRNWKLGNNNPKNNGGGGGEEVIMFPPRHSHATTIFPCIYNSKKDCIWLTGGFTNTYRTFQLKYEDRLSDVWWSDDGGQNWHQVTNLTGDFNLFVDAKDGGHVAPWYSRFAHSLDTLTTTTTTVMEEGMTQQHTTKIMVLMGGFSPLPSNDIWISNDGIQWHFDGYAAWPERAYHTTAVFRQELIVIGGSPLRNDVWSGKLVPRNNHHHPKKKESLLSHKLTWKLLVPHRTAPWSPR